MYVCVCMCISGKGGAERSSLSIQTPDRAPSRMAVRTLVPCERSKSSVARRSNHRGIYSPHDERGERIKRTGWREERGEEADKAYAKMKAREEKKAKGGN